MGNYNNNISDFFTTHNWQHGLRMAKENKSKT